MSLSRRHFLAGASALVVACERQREPETPLAHLYGQDWVHGAYSHYATAYASVETDAEKRSFDSYKVLAQKGITALDGLQSREVPFYVRVAPDAGSFRVERDVPERLTFSADMTQSDRDLATAAWKIAREHLHTDYEEIHRLDWALTGLLTELSRVRNAIDQGLMEEFRICRQLGRLSAGGELPFRLPFQVTRADYENVLRLVLERLENDRERLRQSEAAMIAVGLTARATDAGSASLAANVRKVLVAVVRDADANEKARSLEYPSADHDAIVARAKQLEARIVASAEYRAWLAAEQEKEDVLGKLLTVLDSVTGLPTSSVYRQVMRVWRGGGDYLAYLEIAVGLVPSGTGLHGVLEQATHTTKRCREAVRSTERARALIASLDKPEASPGRRGRSHCGERRHAPGTKAARSAARFLRKQRGARGVKRELGRAPSGPRRCRKFRRAERTLCRWTGSHR